jgi:hypothetical protein
MFLNNLVRLLDLLDSLCAPSRSMVYGSSLSYLIPYSITKDLRFLLRVL